MSLPFGIIVIWFGSTGDIPVGWHLCDGTLSTPDLRNLFIVGAGVSYDPGDSGGNVNHAHNFTADPHDHTHPAGTGLYAGVSRDIVTDSAVATGSTNTQSNLPPYYALAYIMKL